ncbi:MAG: cation diffusion facilitator family transporter [Candidatus Hadarchaeum sp.]|uniref:cation diffusion facilitator family transporter n=1 Tax=Candidatus Hadarchaeum sp. TaxID=2883567 RepID=UPI003D1282E1
MDEADLIAKGERVTKISVITLVTLGSLMIIVGFISGSVALKGSGVDTLGDALGSVVVLIGLRIMRKPPDERFQYGYYKVETLVSMLGAIILSLIGIWIFYVSFLEFFSPKELGYPTITLVLSAVSSAAFFLLAVYKGKTGREINSLSLKTDALASVTSGMAASIVFVSLALSYLGVYHADAIAGMIMAALTLVMSYAAIRESSLTLLDVCTCTDVRSSIERIAKGVPGVREVREVLLRKSGPYIMGEMQIRVDGRLSLERANEIAERVERLVRKQVPALKRLTIEVEPAKGRR